MNTKSLHTLEFHKVRERLASYTSFGASRALALALEPLSDITHARRNQRITTEAVRLLSLRPDVTTGAARDVRELARRAALGSMLDAADILLIKSTLAASRNLRGVIVHAADQKGGLDTLPPGSSCIVNAYTSNHDRLESPDLGPLDRIALHTIDAIGVVHAAILRLQAIMLPVQTLVLSGGH